jgi:hypothetical protein
MRGESGLDGRGRSDRTVGGGVYGRGRVPRCAVPIRLSFRGLFSRTRCTSKASLGAAAKVFEERHDGEGTVAVLSRAY